MPSWLVFLLGFGAGVLFGVVVWSILVAASETHEANW